MTIWFAVLAAGLGSYLLRVLPLLLGDRLHLGVHALVDFVAANLPTRPESVRYTDQQFYGRDNFYFHWTLRH